MAVLRCSVCGRVGTRDFKVIGPTKYTIEGGELIVTGVECASQQACWRRSRPVWARTCIDHDRTIAKEKNQ